MPLKVTCVRCSSIGNPVLCPRADDDRQRHGAAVELAVGSLGGSAGLGRQRTAGGQSGPRGQRRLSRTDGASGDALGSTIVLLAVSFIWAGARAFNIGAALADHGRHPDRLDRHLGKRPSSTSGRATAALSAPASSAFSWALPPSSSGGASPIARVCPRGADGGAYVVVLVRIPVLLGFLPNGMVPSDSPGSAWWCWKA